MKNKKISSPKIFCKVITLSIGLHESSTWVDLNAQCKVMPQLIENYRLKKIFTEEKKEEAIFNPRSMLDDHVHALSRDDPICLEPKDDQESDVRQ